MSRERDGDLDVDAVRTRSERRKSAAAQMSVKAAQHATAVASVFPNGVPTNSNASPAPAT